MSDDTTEDGRAWAKRLREDIDKVTGRRPAVASVSDAEEQPPKDPPKSMRERVQERMREIAREKRRGKE